jgi:hypothetical protein
MFSPTPTSVRVPPVEYYCFRETVAVVVRTKRNTQIQSVPHRKHITSPLQRPTGYAVWGTAAVVVRTKRNTHIQSAPHRKHITSPLQNLTGYCFYGEIVAVYCENLTEHTDTVRTSRKHIMSRLQRPTG